MARTVKDANLQSRTARQGLKRRHEPYWRSLSEGLHLGYRKGERGGKWLARIYNGPGHRKPYTKVVLGAADDVVDAEGVKFFTYGQAQELARKRHKLEARKAVGLDLDDGPYTVGKAADDYLSWYKLHKKSFRQVRSIVETHIRPTLGHVDLSKLSPGQIRSVLNSVATSPARLRTRPGSNPNLREVKGEDGQRARKATANHVFIVLRALLNRALRDGKIVTDDAWKHVEAFRDADASRPDFFTENEAKRFLNACATDFRPLAQAALFIGARYGELVAMRVRDFNTDTKSVHIPRTKGGRPRDIPLWDEGVRLFSRLTAGRSPNDFMFKRANGETWGPSHAQRPMLAACKAARLTPIGFHQLRHSYASALIRRGVPMFIVATALGHTSVRMVEKHYGHLRPDHVAEAIRQAAPDFGRAPPTNVRSLQRVIGRGIRN